MEINSTRDVNCVEMKTTEQMNTRSTHTRCQLAIESFQRQSINIVNSRLVWTLDI